MPPFGRSLSLALVTTAGGVVGVALPSRLTLRRGLGRRKQSERALAISETALGSDHPTVATCRNNLGNVLRVLESGK